MPMILQCISPVPLATFARILVRTHGEDGNHSLPAAIATSNELNAAKNAVGTYVAFIDTEACCVVMCHKVTYIRSATEFYRAP